MGMLRASSFTSSPIFLNFFFSFFFVFTYRRRGVYLLNGCSIALRSVDDGRVRFSFFFNENYRRLVSAGWFVGSREFILAKRTLPFVLSRLIGTEKWRRLRKL